MTTITLQPHVAAELEYICKLHNEHGPYEYSSIDELANSILDSIAQGSRRPGSWERGLLYQLNLIADCDDHQVYRANYGEPK